MRHVMTGYDHQESNICYVSICFKYWTNMG